MTTSQKVYLFEANATGINTAKNQHTFFEFRKHRGAQNLECIKEFYETLFKKREQKNFGRN